MRTSRVVLAGIAVAAAAATTSAFTDSNTGMGTNHGTVAGYGQDSATGTSVSNVAYTPLAADNSKLDYVTFTVGTDVTNEHTSMTLKKGVTSLGSYTCTPTGPAWDSTSMKIKCAATDTPSIDTFDTVGLTVVQ